MVLRPSISDVSISIEEEPILEMKDAGGPELSAGARAAEPWHLAGNTSPESASLDDISDFNEECPTVHQVEGTWTINTTTIKLQAEEDGGLRSLT